MYLMKIPPSFTQSFAADLLASPQGIAQRQRTDVLCVYSGIYSNCDLNNEKVA